MALFSVSIPHSLLRRKPTAIRATSSSNPPPSSLAFDAACIKRAAELADKSAGFTAPHPNFGCVIATNSGQVAGEGYLYAQGTTPAEVLAAEDAGGRCRDATAYLNMEPNHCLGDEAAVSALVQAGISRVVIGIRHPLQYLRGKAMRAFRSHGLVVDVLGEDLQCETLEIPNCKKTKKWREMIEDRESGCGFGFDPTTVSYKVVGICNVAEVELYDSKSNRWQTTTTCL